MKERARREKELELQKYVEISHRAEADALEFENLPVCVESAFVTLLHISRLRTTGRRPCSICYCPDWFSKLVPLEGLDF